jgi:hypothetical protein
MKLATIYLPLFVTAFIPIFGDDDEKELGREGERCSFDDEEEMIHNCDDGLECMKGRRFFIFKGWYCREPMISHSGEYCRFKNTKKTIDTCIEGYECTKTKKYRYISEMKCTKKITVYKKVGEECDIDGTDKNIGFCEQGLECFPLEPTNPFSKGICREHIPILKIGDPCDTFGTNLKGLCQDGAECISQQQGNGGLQSSICKEKKNEGEPCSTEGQVPKIGSCKDGLECVPEVENMGTLSPYICRNRV